MTVQEGIGFREDNVVQYLIDTTLPGYRHDKGENVYRVWFEINIADIGKILISPVRVHISPGKDDKQ